MKNLSELGLTPTEIQRITGIAKMSHCSKMSVRDMTEKEKKTLDFSRDNAILVDERRNICQTNQ